MIKPLSIAKVVWQIFRTLPKDNKREAHKVFPWINFSLSFRAIKFQNKTLLVPINSDAEFRLWKHIKPLPHNFHFRQKLFLFTLLSFCCFFLLRGKTIEISTQVPFCTLFSVCENTSRCPYNRREKNMNELWISGALCRSLLHSGKDSRL